MALTRREQYIFIFAAAAVVLFIANQYILNPVIASRQETSVLKENLAADLEKAHNILKRRTILSEKWEQMQQAGLTTNIDKTETLIMKFLSENADRCNMSLSSQHSERRNVLQDEDIGKIEFTLAGTGDMESITNFLWNIETANVPIKLEDLSIGSNDDSGSTMNLQLTLTSIYIVKKDKNGEVSI